MEHNASIKEQIREAEHQLTEAMRHRDLHTLDFLLHEDLLFITPDGQTITKEADLEAHRSGIIVMSEISPEIEQISVIKNTVVVTLTVDLKGRMNEQHFEGKFRYLRVWKHFESWKVIAGSCIPLQ